MAWCASTSDARCARPPAGESTSIPTRRYSCPRVTTAAPTPDLRRELGLLDATMINVGTMIATAIFIVPAEVAASVPGSGMMILVWAVGGAISLLGALAVAELGAAYPEAGGQYAYLRNAYGPVWGFLYGWAGLLVINPASIA